MKKVYRTIAISCKAKNLVDEISETFGYNKGAFVEKLIEKAYEEMFDNKEK
jgi:hypothetical protein